MPTFKYLLALLLCAAAAPAFAQTDEPGSKDHPMIPRLAGYFINEYSASEFDKQEFIVGDDKLETYEGRFWRIDYWLRDGARKLSNLEITRNFTTAFTSKGGAVVFNSGNTRLTLRMKTATGELWCDLDILGDGDIYNLKIVEKGGMTQQLELSASELAKALNETGSVAVHNILFDTGKATIKPESSAALAPIGEVLKADTALRLEIQGHTDNVGAKAANQTLSQARAAAVRDYLIKTFAITPDRLTATGLGDTKPVADNATDTGRAQNRRVELVRLGAKFPPPASSATEWTGKITSGMMAIGGETTGIVIVTAQDQLELQPADQAMRQRLQQLNGKTVTIRGVLETRPGVEVKTRRIIKVSEIIERL